MYVFRRLPDALVEVVEMAELRLEAPSCSLTIWESRLCPGDAGLPSRTLREPLGSSDSLWGRLCGAIDADFPFFSCRFWTGGVFARFFTSVSGCRLATKMLPRCCSAMLLARRVHRFSHYDPGGISSVKRCGVCFATGGSILIDVLSPLTYPNPSRLPAKPKGGSIGVGVIQGIL